MIFKNENYDHKTQIKIKPNAFLVLFTSTLIVDFASILYIHDIINKNILIHFFLTVFWHAIFCLLLTLPLLFIKKQKTIYSIFIFIVIIPFTLLEFLHIVVYNAVFHESSYITLSAFNKDIAYDFFYTYLELYHLLVILFFLSFLAIIYKLNIRFLKPSNRILIIISIVLTPFFFRFNIAYFNSIPTIRMTKVWIDYRESCNKLINQTNVPIDSNTILKSKNLGKELHIIVIGESTSATHMSLFGYNRNTNPLLSIIKNELLLFNNVHTEKVHTIESLLDVFTFKLENNTSSTLIDVFNASGYHTYWLSNQPYFEKSITPVTIISKRSNDSKFINPINLKGTDYKVLKPFKHLIKNLKKDKQIIVVHLKGTHTPYEKHYPKKFNKFINGTSKFGENAVKTINYYDNAILYNDYILSRLINIVKSKSNYSVSLTYFSDHGDEVYDNRNFFGHNQALLPSIQMTHVPCFIWLNEKMKKRTFFANSNFNSEKKLKNISNTLLDLYQIEFKPIPKTDSYFYEKH